MAVDDLSNLRQQLPEVFADTVVPDWDDEWIVAPVDDPEANVYEEDRVAFGEPTIEELLASELPLDSPVGGFDWGGDSGLPDFGAFPGSPPKKRDPEFYPPPDAFAFYLPFHHFYPTWWGIYLVAEPTQRLAAFINHRANGILSSAESMVVTRIFLYAHEAFHHVVESFATRLETTHRKPLYKAGFNRVYQRTAGTDDCLEEALANANGVRRVKERAFTRDKAKTAAAVTALRAFIEGGPPGYRRAFEFVTNRGFNKGRYEFAELNHREALNLAPKDPGLWATFPHAFSGISRITSRVNYVCRKDSPLAKRLNLGLRYLRYRDLRKKLIELGGCRYVREGKGGHEIWESPRGHRFPVPRHPGDLRQATLAKIIKQADMQMSNTQFIVARA